MQRFMNWADAIFHAANNSRLDRKGGSTIFITAELIAYCLFNLENLILINISFILGIRQDKKITIG